MMGDEVAALVVDNGSGKITFSDTMNDGQQLTMDSQSFKGGCQKVLILFRYVQGWFCW